MKLSKNIFTCALFLAIFSPILSDDEYSEEESSALIEESTETKINPAQQSVITEIGSELIEAAISAIADAIESAHTAATATQISEKTAEVLLQEFIHNLADGDVFTLNDLNYIVKNSNKNSEISEENK